ncbi:cytochrome P450 [Pseudohaliea rubra]|uniref:Putative cytochrome P450 hydroxylase n=1 Tax=Pseudohaliea rubra DSM 19751 TaxID=1265313 RepID=A0A095WZ54_9GAMM|nr:cytochrome P450 [Pseudohaliea rubra]KGE03919.1 putative cytochrome P450 hydroxylase [Pseudohaliea rubra DSM 19751]
MMGESATLNRYEAAFEALCDRRLRQSMYGECDVLMGDVLLTLHGEAHTARRSMELKLFRRNFIHYYEREVYPGIVRETLAPFLASGGMDLPEFGFRVNINLSASIAGVDREQSAEETEALLALVRKFSEGATLFHSTRDKAEVVDEVAAAMAVFDERFFQRSLARREALLTEHAAGRLAEEDLPRDVLTVLLANREAQGLSLETIRREVAFFMQAASHSTANAMVHAFHEIISWCREHPQDAERLATDVLFLQRCVHESLRLHPASPVAWRTTTCPFALPTGTDVAEGDSVVIDLAAANQDPAIFGADADRYNPHRTVAERKPPYALTFGVGLHTCFGRELAGGSLPTAATVAEEHPIGTVTNLLKTLFEHGAAPDPKHPPVPDPDTERANWKRYPVLFMRTPA